MANLLPKTNALKPLANRGETHLKALSWVNIIT